MSSRMGDYKPMLKIGSMSIAERIVATLKQAGVQQIVMVTGYNADALERHLSGNGIVFLRNPDYEHTHMFDSARIGIEYLADKCDRILFTPVDIPLFTSLTVTRLTETEDELVCPVFDGQEGHPVIMSRSVAEYILKDSGEGGMRGAFSRCGVDMSCIAVTDEGILHDADTPQDYDRLLEYHNKQLARPVVDVSIARETNFLDHRTAMLLRLIGETGSVRTACQRMQISYSVGWNSIRTLETQMRKSIVRRNQGGSGGGNSELTEDGRDLLQRYTGFESRLRELAAEQFEEFFQDYF